MPHNYPLDKLEPGLNETAFYDPTNFTYPAGTHICEVEIDPNTGVVRVDRFTAVDDFGTIINPMIVEGQVHGGLVQGIGQASSRPAPPTRWAPRAAAKPAPSARHRQSSTPCSTRSHRSA